MSIPQKARRRCENGFWQRRGKEKIFRAAKTVSSRDEEIQREEEFYCRQKATFRSEKAGLRMKFGSFLVRN